MATQRIHGIVPGEESEIHNEPHVEGTRISVRVIQARVEEAGRRPEEVADQLNLDLGDVYAALAYYHNNPSEMLQVRERHERAASEAARRSSVRPPKE